MAKISPEAARIGYESGIQLMAPLAQRVIDLESAVAALDARMKVLEAALRNSGVPVHLRDVERRTT
jgi:hypothetical protein